MADLAGNSADYPDGSPLAESQKKAIKAYLSVVKEYWADLDIDAMDLDKPISPVKAFHGESVVPGPVVGASVATFWGCYPCWFSPPKKSTPKS